jgi:DNA modification methylase
MIDVPQPALTLSGDRPLDSVEEYTFEPIKGYPMLNWKGKRPFTSTHYYPAQLKEVHGPEINGWRNKIYWGDNLQVMSHLLRKFRGKIDLVYIDPPFDSKANYTLRVQVKGRNATSAVSTFEEKQYADLWVNDEYLQFMFERLVLLRELLSANGSIYVHLDWHVGHYIKIILDTIMGKECFMNDIVWQKIRTTKAQSNSFGSVHDYLLVYRKSVDSFFKPLFKPFDQEYIKTHYKKDNTGRLVRGVSLLQGGQGPGRWFGDNFLEPPVGMHWIWGQDRINEAIANGRIRFTSNGKPEKIQYLDEMEGDIIDDLWTDIYPINSQAIEDTEYPTQKPEKLLERIIQASCPPEGLILDCFMGSGTAQAAALRLGRRFIGVDINLGAVQITTKRLLNIAQELSVNQQSLLSNDDEVPVIHYLGFEVYNVNNYDVFRNPSEARDLILNALEVNLLPSGNLFDGEKDGRLWKIMPVDRISTRADLNPLISGFDYKSFERRKAEKPNQPVEKITLVCMGHEPDLKAALQKEVHPYELDVEVVDILRDRQDLQFKRDSEAKFIVQHGLLIVERFYPMNLLSKLSLQKEKVGDWRELVESIMIDWNYDGAVLQPGVVDIPEKNELVTGKYRIPEDSGTIRVKITDLLSESLEMDVANG